MRDHTSTPPGASPTPRRDGADYILTVLTEIARQRAGDRLSDTQMIRVSIDACCTSLMFDSREETLGHFDGLLARGLPIASLVDTVLPYCAQRLGEMWARDTARFADVTVGSSRLHTVLHHMRDRYLSEVRPEGREIALVVPDGEDHIFAPVLLATQLEREGHRVHTLLGLCRAEITARLDALTLDAVGISLGHTMPTAEIVALVEAVRGGTDAPLMIGGPGLPSEIPQELIADVSFWGSEASNVLEYVKNCGAPSNPSVRYVEATKSAWRSGGAGIGT